MKRVCSIILVLMMVIGTGSISHAEVAEKESQKLNKSELNKLNELALDLYLKGRESELQNNDLYIKYKKMFDENPEIYIDYVTSTKAFQDESNTYQIAEDTKVKTQMFDGTMVEYEVFDDGSFVMAKISTVEVSDSPTKFATEAIELIDAPESLFAGRRTYVDSYTSVPRFYNVGSTYETTYEYIRSWALYPDTKLVLNSEYTVYASNIVVNHVSKTGTYYVFPTIVSFDGDKSGATAYGVYDVDQIFQGSPVYHETYELKMEVVHDQLMNSGLVVGWVSCSTSK